MKETRTKTRAEQETTLRKPPEEEAAQRQELLNLVSEFLREIKSGDSGPVELGAHSRLERDLGIDSLGRSELILRIERALRVDLPIAEINEIETVDDLHQLVKKAKLRGASPVRRKVAAPSPLSDVAAATDARTLLEILDWHAARHADRLHVTVLEDDETVLGALTYGALHERARGVGAGLLARGITSGDRIALMLPTSTDFFIAFMGVLLAGAIPVPIYPPSRLSQIEEHVRRQAGILQNAGACMLVTVPEGRALAGLLCRQVASLTAVESVDNISVDSPLPPVPPPRPEDIALIQYTWQHR
jgi:acyl carrier protein